MPLQNRVLPTGEIVAAPTRGLFTGNRGILRFDGSALTARRWSHPHWICCTPAHPRGQYHGPQPTHGWTPLFFLDEAVALAAGHRPCGYCRPKAYAQFRKAWQLAHGPVARVIAIDRALHAARVTRDRRQITHQARLVALPDGSFIAHAGHSWLVLGDFLLRLSADGYDLRQPRSDALVTVLTPAPTIAILSAGYQPALHPSATAPA